MPAKDGSPEVLLLDPSDEGDAIEGSLEGAGCTLLRAQDVAGAEAVFGGSKPDVIVIGLEAEGALGLCDLIRALPRGGTAAIILIGGPAEDVNSAADAILRGADAYLSRPVGGDELLRKLESLIGPLPAHQGIFGAPEPPDAAPPAREPTQVLADPHEDAPGASPSGEETFDATAETELRPVADLDEALGIDPEDLRRTEGSQDRTNPGLGDGALPYAPPYGLANPPSELGPLDPSLIDDEDLLAAEELPISGWTGEHMVAMGDLDQLGTDGSRPEPTHVLSGQQPAPPAAPGSVLASATLPSSTGAGADAELSDEFRRVIDEVAQRLFPGADPDEYEDEAFDELQTIVPAVADPRVPIYEDIDEFSLDSMETYPGSEGGLTLSLFDDVTSIHGDGSEDATEDEVQTGVEQTKPRAVDAPAEEQPPPPVAADPWSGAEEEDRAAAVPAEGPARRSDLPPPGAPEDLAGALPGGLARAEEPATAPRPGEDGPAAEPVPVVRIREQTLSRGALGDHPFPVLLSACLGGRLRARLVLRREAEATAGGLSRPPQERVVVLDDGRPVLASSTVAADRLIEMLRLEGRLTAAQYDQCRSLVDTSGRRPGAILVELGLAKPEELLSLVRWHFEEILFACFSWREGSFRLEPLSPRWRTRIAIDRTGPEVLLEGLRRRYGAEELGELLGGWSARLQSRLEPAAALPEGLLPAEERLPTLCDGRRPLEGVVEASGLDGAQALAALYGLVLLGHLEMPEFEPLPRIATRGADSGVDRALVEERIEQSREADYFTLLGLGPGASTYEVRLAHERRMAELAPERLATIGAPDLAAQAADVRYVIDEALEILSNESLRDAYRRARFGSPE